MKFGGDKPFSRYNCICSVIDITLCNAELKERRGYMGRRYTKNVIRTIINENDINEYKQMFQEILKKHNRKWDGTVD